MNEANGIVSFTEFGLNLGGFNFTAEGIFELTRRNYSEINLYASYTLAGFTLTLADYYSAEGVHGHSYFDLNNHTTSHSLELGLTFEPENVPIWASVNTMLWGNDKDEELGKQLYSTYIEVGGYYDFENNSTVSLGIGAGLPNSMYSDYEPKFSICNMELTYEKRLEYEHFTLPLSVSLIGNPFLRKTYVNCGVGISF
ncbi:MAG: hypothetical protein J6Z27_00185 [Bacteroidales bacterium]|nr:hypothetical protein [Bacteroidales bacterium]